MWQPLLPPLTNAGEDFQEIRLLLAPTGKAANNIKGNTIHIAHGILANQSLIKGSMSHLMDGCDTLLRVPHAYALRISVYK